MIRAATTALAAILLSASPASAQMEIGGGVVWNGGYEAGSATAAETPNSSTGATPITLFRTRARAAAVTGLDTRVAFYFAPRLSAEGVFQLSKPTLRVTTADDFENASARQVVGTTSIYLLGGSLVYHFGSGKVVPFVLGGGSYLRMLDEDNAEVVTGNEVHAGGGVKLWFSETGRGFGARVDAQVSARSKSPGFDETRRILPAVTAGLSYRF